MWHVKFLDEAKNDVRNLDNSLKKQIFKGIAKVSTNPLPHHEHHCDISER
jgi:mRNA interferase RelE/StbE